MTLTTDNPSALCDEKDRSCCSELMRLTAPVLSVSCPFEEDLMAELPAPVGYTEWLVGLKARIRQAQARAMQAVNAEQTLLYWEIGRDILDRQEKQGWGAKVIDRLAIDLKGEFPGERGFSPRNLKYMRSFADAWPDRRFVQGVLARMPWWTQIALLDKLKDQELRIWYAKAAIQNGWTRNVLVLQIESELHKRQGGAVTNFTRTLPPPDSEMAQQALKDPYNFEFMSISAMAHERHLEAGLIENLKRFLIELGMGFAFVGSQYHLEVGGQDYYLDLVFFHLKLKRYVVIDLKMDDFAPEYVGKMNFYLAVLDDLKREPYMAPSIGLILCKSRNRTVVEYALRDAAKPIGVAEYTVQVRLAEELPPDLARDLPTVEQIEQVLVLEESPLDDGALPEN
ncbi:PDDEXK nuclease domain-containing protein [Azospirillum doebereinerae]|nr:PDDEXK nuclease domain-containing protein [Azospirillum doebereinerae]